MIPFWKNKIFTEDFANLTRGQMHTILSSTPKRFPTAAAEASLPSSSTPLQKAFHAHANSTSLACVAPIPAS